MILRLTRDLGVNLAGVDIILRLKDHIEELEQDVNDLTHEVSKMKQNGGVPANKTLVTKKSIYELVIFESK
jgi:MerR family transcriptional regulator/heat shock protein HspR